MYLPVLIDQSWVTKKGLKSSVKFKEQMTVQYKNTGQHDTLT